MQFRRLWLEMYVAPRQSFVLLLILRHRIAFRAPWAWRFRQRWRAMAAPIAQPGPASRAGAGASWAPEDMIQVAVSKWGCAWWTHVAWEGPWYVGWWPCMAACGGQDCIGKRGPLLDPLSVPTFGPHLYKVLSAGKREGPKNGPLFRPPVRNCGAKVGVQEADAAGCMCCRGFSGCEGSFRGVLGMVGPCRAMPCVPVPVRTRHVLLRRT